VAIKRGQHFRIAIGAEIDEGVAEFFRRGSRVYETSHIGCLSIVSKLDLKSHIGQYAVISTTDRPTRFAISFSSPEW